MTTIASGGAPPGAPDHEMRLPTTLVCSGCGGVAPPGDPFVPACPAAAPGDDTDHVLERRVDLARLAWPDDRDPNPFVRYRTLFHAWHVARAGGWSDARYIDLVRSLDDAVAAVDGHGFRATPFGPAPDLGRRLGLVPPGAAWVKDETGNVAGSHKGRHLFGVLLELQVSEALRGRDPTRPLAIASCGNAALAAAVVARAARRELRVFVPDAADPDVVERLRTLGAAVVVCRRGAGEPGDPSYRRLREAVAAGAVPFTCQGPDNGLAIEGGATLGWEIADALRAAGAGPLDRIVVQVGGGALASGVALGLGEAVRLGALARVPRFDTVQTAGGWPLARAVERVHEDLGSSPGEPVEPARLEAAMADAARRRSRYMWPWETEPRGVAHGILDDETYDWLAVTRAMLATGGRALVVDDATLLEGARLARDLARIDADETGAAGIAGLLALARDGLLRPGEAVAVLATGARHVPRPAEARSSAHPSQPVTRA